MAVMPAVPQELYVHEDIMGSARRFSGADGVMFAEIEYDVWGLPVARSGAYGDGDGNGAWRDGRDGTGLAMPAGIDDALNPRFTNHTYDDTLGMYHAQYRFLDAENRGFTQVDPVKDSLNWYGYCGGNPVGFVDPLGLEKLTPKPTTRPKMSYADYSSRVPSTTSSPTPTPTPSPTSSPSPNQNSFTWRGYEIEIIHDYFDYIDCAYLDEIYNSLTLTDITSVDGLSTKGLLAKLIYAEVSGEINSKYGGLVAYSMLNRILDDNGFSYGLDWDSLDPNRTKDKALRPLLVPGQYTPLDDKGSRFYKTKYNVEKEGDGGALAWERAKEHATLLYAMVGEKSGTEIMKESGLTKSEIQDQYKALGINTENLVNENSYFRPTVGSEEIPTLQDWFEKHEGREAYHFGGQYFYTSVYGKGKDNH